MLGVIVVAGASLVVLGAVVSWTASNTRLTQRSNEYFNTLAAAESATEQVVASIARDFQSGGEAAVYDKLSIYRNLVPGTLSLLNSTVADILNPLSQPGPAQSSTTWPGLEFSDGQGHAQQSYVERISSLAYTGLETKFAGLRGNAATYRILSNVRTVNTTYPAVGIRQDIQVADIPIFQFHVFYSVDLEISPGSDMTFTGPVHSNGRIYLEPNSKTVTFQGPVTSSRQILHSHHPDDPVGRTFGAVNYLASREANVNSLNLPLGTNVSANLHQIIEVPPSTEAVDSPLGRQRYYNKADLIILVSNNTVTAKSGVYNNFQVSVPWLVTSNFITTNASFYNKRQSQTIKVTEINVQKLNEKSATLATLLGRTVKIVFVNDLRTQTTSSQAGVRIINGQILPSDGLTLVTPNPLYVQGHYNAPTASLGTTNTSGTRPASLIADAVTVLSVNWSDINSGAALSARAATSTTLNAAVVAGTVPTGNGYYSGGAENFLRFLEDWGNDKLTFNGSMVALYYSQIATAPWGTADVYNTPQRNYFLDPNLKDSTKLPPGTPQLRTLIRSDWQVVKAGTVQ